MGLFDWYVVLASLACPRCGAPLQTWQGKDGPCALFVWQQGVRHPIAQEIDPEVACGEEDRSRFELPARFIIYSYDCPTHGRVEAIGRTADGVWDATTLVDPAG